MKGNPPTSSSVLVISGSMIGLREALEATIWVLLGKESVSELTSKDRKAVATEATEKLLTALKEGDLLAYAVLAPEKHHVLLPQTYWNDWIAGWRPFLTGWVEVSRIATRKSRGEVPDVAGWPCAIDRRRFDHWLDKVRSKPAPDTRTAAVETGGSPTSLGEPGEEQRNCQPVPVWVPLLHALGSIPERSGWPLEDFGQHLLQAAGDGAFSMRGVCGQVGNANIDRFPIPQDHLKPRLQQGADGSAIDWHNGESPPSLQWTDRQGSLEYVDLEVERDGFDGWLLLAKPKKFRRDIPSRYLGIREAMNRLRRHIEAREKRKPNSMELASRLLNAARNEDLPIWWLDGNGHALSITSSSWTRRHAQVTAERIISNGAAKGMRLVFVRHQFARWLGDLPDEVHPPPKKLEEMDAAPIPRIAREWSREPGAESWEKIKARLWHAYFDGDFALQAQEGSVADFDRWHFATMIEMHKIGNIVMPAGSDDDPEHRYRVLGAWAGSGFPGMTGSFRLDTVEKYLLPRKSLEEWCARAGQALPRFWQSKNGESNTTARSRALPLRRLALKAIRNWYADRVKEFDRVGKRPSREDDYRDAIKRFGESVTHARIRDLRNELAPHWTRRGRPPARAKVID